jgi:hypothetical protein
LKTIRRRRLATTLTALVAVAGITAATVAGAWTMAENDVFGVRFVGPLDRYAGAEGLDARLAPLPESRARPDWNTGVGPTPDFADGIRRALAEVRTDRAGG